MSARFRWIRAGAIDRWAPLRDALSKAMLLPSGAKLEVDNEIFRIGRRRHRPEAAHTNDVFERRPSWSPDGKRIALIEIVAGSYHG